MKKLLASGICLLLVTGLLFAAGSQEQTPKRSVRIWVEKSFSDDANMLMEKRIEQFSSDSGISAKYEFINALDLMTKLNAAIEAGRAPDIVSANLYKVLSYGDNNPFLDVTSWIEEVNKSRPMFDSLVTGTKITGKNYFVPFYNSSTLLYLRKDIFDKKGVAIPKTWDELLEAAKQVSDPENGVYGFGMGSGPTDEDGENTFRMINWSNGGSLIAEDGSIIANKSPVTAELLAKYKELYDAGAIPPAATTWGPSGNNKSYLIGESAMVFNAPTLYNAMANDPNYADLLANTVILPPPDGRVSNTVLGLASGWGVTKTTENQSEAKEFIIYMMEPEWYNEYMQLIAPVFVPVFQDARENPAYLSGVNKAAIDYAENATGYYGYPTQTLDGMVLGSKHYFQFPVCKMLNNIVTKGLSSQQVLDEFTKDAQVIKQSF